MFFNRKVIIFKVRMWSLNREGSKSKIFCTQSEMCFAFSCEKGIFDHLLGIGPLNNFPLAFQRGVSSDILSLFCLGVSSKASDTLNWWPASSLDLLFFVVVFFFSHLTDLNATSSFYYWNLYLGFFLFASKDMEKLCFVAAATWFNCLLSLSIGGGHFGYTCDITLVVRFSE